MNYDELTQPAILLDRINDLEAALRKMHSTVHNNQVRVVIKDSNLSHFGRNMLGEINLIVRDALGRDDKSLRYIDFPSETKLKTEYERYCQREREAGRIPVPEVVLK
jgi:hypothetical protein